MSIKAAGCSVAGFAAGLSIMAGATRAAAQDIDVRVKISPNIAGRCSRSSRPPGPEVRDELARTIRDVVRGFRAAEPGDGAAGRNSDFKFEQTKRRRRRCRSPNPRLDLKNLSGASTSLRGPAEATIELVYRSRGRTEADAKLGLTSVTVRAAARRAHHGGVQLSRRPAAAVSRGHHLQRGGAGRHTRHRGHDGGSVTIKGVKGDLSASSVGGMSLSVTRRIDVRDDGRR